MMEATRNIARPLARDEGLRHAPAGAPRAVRLWLWAIAALIMVMVVVGGATRLTESGLSITEWKPVTGIFPPLSPAAWAAEFDRYKAIPQYEILNKGMGIDAFKRIYWWEWAHRLLGRLTGAAFLLPLLWFAATGAIRGRVLALCMGLFALGGLQGAVGWWMVASGLSARTSVSQYRLAVHLTLACLILCATVALACALAPALPGPAAPRRLRAGALGLVGLVLAQIFAGGLVAGLDAGMAFDTWPLMDGHLIPPPEQLLAAQPWWRNGFENALTVQFDHRMIAYALWAASLLHAIAARRTPAACGALILFTLVSLQATLGIATLLSAVALPVALAHQLGATVVLVAATVHASDLMRAPQRSR